MMSGSLVACLRDDNTGLEQSIRYIGEDVAVEIY